MLGADLAKHVLDDGGGQGRVVGVGHGDEGLAGVGRLHGVDEALVVAGLLGGELAEAARGEGGGVAGGLAVLGGKLLGDVVAVVLEGGGEGLLHLFGVVGAEGGGEGLHRLLGVVLELNHVGAP